jgi:hypothetical protein
MPPHNFEHERSRVRNSRRMYVVDSFADPLQRSRRANCKIGHGHVVIYRSNESHNPKVSMMRDLFIRDAIWSGLMRSRTSRMKSVRDDARTLRSKRFDVIRPLGPEHVCSCKRTIPSAHDQCVDALLDKVICSRKTAFGCSERLRACSTDESASLFSHVPPPGRKIEQRTLRAGKQDAPYLRKPTAHIVPSNAHDVAPLEGPSAGVVTRPIAQESAVSEAQIIYERRIAYLDVERRGEVGRIGSLPVCVSADKALIPFSDDPRLTSTVLFCSHHIFFSSEKRWRRTGECLL